MGQNQDISMYETRIALLKEFYEALETWKANAFRNNPDADLIKDTRSFINRNLMAVRSIVQDVGLKKVLVLQPPPMVGGPIVQIDPFDTIFENFYGQSVIPRLLDILEQAIGIYEHLSKDSGLIRLYQTETLDLVNAIERALRPSFQSGPPNNEKEVQDKIETILNTLGVDSKREQESAPVGPRLFKPDFSVQDLDLAIEIKLATKTKKASELQEEIAADISGYKTKWRNLLVVIYDRDGVIHDPEQLRKENMKHFGVTLMVIKH